MLTKLRTWRFHLIVIAGAPWYSTDLSVIHLFVILNHILICFSSFPINILILLIKLITILVSLIVKLIDCFLMVPILVSLKVILVCLWILLVIESIWSSLALTIHLINIWNSLGGMLINIIRIALQSYLLLSYLLVERVYLSVKSIHPMVIHVFPRVIICVIEWTVLSQTQQIRHAIIRKTITISVLINLTLLLFF